MFRWYVINTYSGHEGKVARNLDHRRHSMNQSDAIRRIEVPQRDVVETGRDGQKVAKKDNVLPGYVLVQMVASPETISLVRNTPGVIGFVGQSGQPGHSFVPVPLTPVEVERLLHRDGPAGPEGAKPKTIKTEFSLGEAVKVISGPLSDFDGEIIEINAEGQKLKVHVSIFERQVPVELNFSDVRKLD
jgi:transcription termination/antitermination protein NusG